eukprot:TRINITY_DN107406_c0_g1_i1.p1 TRINITY_DN107406_c0_g1~~TRINITY_DN107406_c0_g1_i1.p1  ORF type:complete len:158 (+),score=37.86 TRINITY_DN107406_c0_g1_i1:95-568(+)
MGGSNSRCCAGEEVANEQEVGCKPVNSLVKEEVVQESPAVAAIPAVPAAPPAPPAPAAPSTSSPTKVGDEFTVEIVKGVGEKAKLGIDVDLTDGIALVVDQVNDGLIDDWNKDHPDLAINKFDRIVEVNGKRGSANDITEVCKNDTTLVMKVLKMKK